MKKFRLFKKFYKSNCNYGEGQVESYVKICLYIGWEQIFFFCVSVPNYSVNRRNLFSAVLRVLEHESIGMSKYNRVKEILRKRVEDDLEARTAKILKYRKKEY